MRNEPAFAIVRIDIFQDRDDARFTVTRVVWTEEAAEKEVQRLNAVNADMGCRYVWQSTRVEARA